MAFLRGLKDFPGIEKALRAYLKYHQKHAAPWMLSELGVAMEINQKAAGATQDPDAIKLAYGRCAGLAMKNNEPIALIAAADVLLAHKYYEIDVPEGVGGPGKVRLGDLLDQAIKLSPHRWQPILMSLALAEQIKDPKRMADSAETLLSLGWPEVDGTWRVEVPRRVTALAKTLEADGRAAEAKSLLDRLPGLEARDVVIRLTWKKEAILDLEVDEPLGATAGPMLRRTVFGGALVKTGKTKDPETVYICPRGFSGDYVARVKVFYNNDKNPVRIATLELITHEGTPEEKVVTKTISLDKPQEVKITLDKGRRTKVLPFEAPNKINMPADEPAAPRDPNRIAPKNGAAPNLPAKP